MLIIGHRGAAALAPENTLEALKKGYDVGADVLEFDVQITRDGVPVVIHDSTLLRTHGVRKSVRYSTHASLREAAARGHSIATLDEVLDTFFGKVVLNLEIKGRGGKIIAEHVKKRCIKKPSDWHGILFSSFKARELAGVRKVSKHAQLALLHNRNPFAFIAFHRQLRFTAVGFHRLYTNPLACEIAKQLGIFMYAYTVNRPRAAQLLEQLGIEGVVTDDPKHMRDAIL
jgi:glycerophosphoryl diester phosphodiesterase